MPSAPWPHVYLYGCLQAAEADLTAADSLAEVSPGAGGAGVPELQQLRGQLRALRQRDRHTDRSVYGRMFRT